MKRFPLILTGIINDVFARQEIIRQDESLSENDRAIALSEGSTIIQQVNIIKSEISRDSAMPYVKSQRNIRVFP